MLYINKQKHVGLLVSESLHHCAKLPFLWDGSKVPGILPWSRRSRTPEQHALSTISLISFSEPDQCDSKCIVQQWRPISSRLQLGRQSDKSYSDSIYPAKMDTITNHNMATTTHFYIYPGCRQGHFCLKQPRPRVLISSSLRGLTWRYVDY